MNAKYYYQINSLYIQIKKSNFILFLVQTKFRCLIKCFYSFDSFAFAFPATDGGS